MSAGKIMFVWFVALPLLLSGIDSILPLAGRKTSAAMCDAFEKMPDVWFEAVATAETVTIDSVFAPPNSCVNQFGTVAEAAGTAG